MITIYLDTNCINANQVIPAVNELEKLYEQGKIDIEKTDTLDTELQGNPHGNAKRLQKSLNYIESYGPAVFGHSRWDYSVFGSQTDAQKLDRMLEMLWGKKGRSQYSKQQIRDAMHISTAARYGGNYFITNDKELLNKSKEIKQNDQIIVCSPENCLNSVKKTLEINSS
jgi:predicted nucleic acid-binding protein